MGNLPETMFAALQLEDGYSGQATGPVIDDAELYLRAAEVPVPTPSDSQVVVKMIASVVNPSDLHFIKGEYGQPRRKDFPAGFEGCGRIIAAGEKAKGMIGQRVAFAVSLGGSGTWAQYALTEANTCIPLRDDVSDVDGASLIVNPLTAVAMVDMVKAHCDAFILTAGASQLGKLMIGLGRDMGLKPIAVVRRGDVAENLKALGATEVLVTSDPDFDAKMKAAMKAHKPRMMLDAVSDQTSADMFVAMPTQARWVTYGKMSPVPPQLDQMGQFIFMNKRIEGFWLVNWMRDTPTADKIKVFGEVQARFADGRWRTDVAVKLPLTEIVSGLGPATKMTDGKIIIQY